MLGNNSIMGVGSILITGGAGYVGLEVTKKILELYPKSQIIALDKFSRENVESLFPLKKIYPQLTIETADIKDVDHIDNIFKKYNPSVVINLTAAVNEVDLDYESVVNFIKIAKKYKTNKLIFQSPFIVCSHREKITEYGSKSSFPDCGKATSLTEKEIVEFNDQNFQVCILRPATVIGCGKGFGYETDINLSCIKSVYNIPIRYFESEIHHDKSYLYVEDNVEAIIFSVDNMDTMNGGVYNLSSFNTDLNRVINTIKKHLGRDFTYEFVKENPRNQKVCTLSSEEIKKLGFEFKGELDSVIQSMIKDLLKQKNSVSFNYLDKHSPNFQFNHPPIKGLVEITPKSFIDERGYFMETYHQKEFERHGIPPLLVQENQSLSKKGVLRGLHLQKYPYGQGKLVRVIKGKVLDVAVDVRVGSETFGRWHSVELSEENKKLFWIPEGFLHGFVTLEDETIFQYKCTNYFNKDSEDGTLWNDPTLNINWGFLENKIAPIVSDKDKQLPLFEFAKYLSISKVE